VDLVNFALMSAGGQNGYDMTVYTASSDGSIGSILASYATSQHQDNPELDDGAALYGGFSGGTGVANVLMVDGSLTWLTPEDSVRYRGKVR
jgi:prepilin-type processing-associated H-X9-DG protein